MDDGPRIRQQRPVQADHAKGHRRAHDLDPALSKPEPHTRLPLGNFFELPTLRGALKPNETPSECGLDADGHETVALEASPTVVAQHESHAGGWIGRRPRCTIGAGNRACECEVHGLPKLVTGERLDKNVHTRGASSIIRGPCSHQKRRDVGLAISQVLHQRHAIHLGHTQVRDDQVVLAIAKCCQRRPPSFCSVRLTSFPLEDASNLGTACWLIINDENSCLHGGFDPSGRPGVGGRRTIALARNMPAVRQRPVHWEGPSSSADPAPEPASPCKQMASIVQTR